MLLFYRGFCKMQKYKMEIEFVLKKNVRANFNGEILI